MAGNSPREQNYWPAFVDAFANLVLVLVFIIVVFTFALFYFVSQLVKQKIEETEGKLQAQQQMRIMSDEEIETLRGSRVEAESRVRQPEPKDGSPVSGLSTLRRRTDIEREASQVAVEDQGLPVIVSGLGGAVVITFAPGVADLSPEERNEIQLALGAGLQAPQIELIAEPAEASPSEGRRLAYYRIAAVRNLLVGLGVMPDRIDMHIGDPAPPGTPRSQVVIRTGAGVGE